MKEWLHRMLFNDEPLGDKVLNIIIVIFAFLFVFGWAWLILNFILTSIIDFVRWVLRKFGYDSYDVDDKLYVIEEKIEKIFKFPYSLLPNISERFGFNNKLKFKLIKSIIIGLAIPATATTIWLASSTSPINDYMLITKSTTAKGYIIKAEEDSEEVSYNDDRSHGIRYYYNYDYYFTLPNGTKINSSGQEDGNLPEYLSDLNASPYQIDVEYLSKNPKICRVKNMNSSDKTILAWLRHRVTIGAIIVLLFFSWGFTIIKSGVKEYTSKTKKAIIDSKKLHDEI